MTKAKNIEYKAGMKCSCGPPMRAGAYKGWNWCRICSRIWDKQTYRCPECNQMLRSHPKNQSPSAKLSRLQREAKRIEVLEELSRYEI
tara:strand:+ start:676 stop:939 length:264 start_codon:yes stop_codon:yes gene_type:complete